MKTKCKYCKTKHDRKKLDVMNAKWIPNAFCSDLCHSAYLIMNKVGTKMTSTVYVEDGSMFEENQMVKMGGEAVLIETINGNEIEVCRYEATG